MFLAGPFWNGGSNTEIRRVNGWALTVADADAALDADTIGGDRASSIATQQYRRLATGYVRQGIFLGAEPVTTFEQSAPDVTDVSFPGGGRLTVPEGPADVWLVQVGASTAPDDETMQGNFLLGSNGDVLKAVPVVRPGVIGDQPISRTPNEIAALDWSSSSTVALPNPGCNGPACPAPEGTPSYTGGGTASVALAHLADGAVVVKVEGSHLKPDETYDLTSGAGVVAIAKSDSDGSLMMTSALSRSQVQDAIAGPEAAGGLFRLTPAFGPESYYGCPFGGTFNSDTMSCTA